MSFVGSLVQYQPDSSGSGISGTLTAVTITGTAPNESVPVNSAPFTGTINGSAVTLNLAGFLGATAPVYDTLNGGSLTISALNSGTGSIGAGTFQSSVTSSYNAAVAALHSTVGKDHVAAVAARQQAQHQQANAQAALTVHNDLSTLQSAVNFASDLSSLSNDVNQTNTDLGKVKSGAAAGPNADGGYCYNLTGNVHYDVIGVVDYDITGPFSHDLNTLTTGMGNAPVRYLHAAERPASLSAVGLPAPAGASDGITAAQQAVKEAISAADADIDQVNADDASACAVASGIATGSCAGQGPGSPPSPVRHIS
jgi:hypothetical protein